MKTHTFHVLFIMQMPKGFFSSACHATWRYMASSVLANGQPVARTAEN